MTGSDYDRLVEAVRMRYADATALVEASLRRYRPFDPQIAYGADEREPWDAPARHRNGHPPHAHH